MERVWNHRCIGTYTQAASFMIYWDNMNQVTHEEFQIRRNFHDFMLAIIEQPHNENKDILLSIVSMMAGWCQEGKFEVLSLVV